MIIHLNIGQLNDVGDIIMFTLHYNVYEYNNNKR